MHPQLQAIRDDLTAAQSRLDAIAASTPDDRWTMRAHPDRWSVGECVAHLNITTKAFLPDFRRALADPSLHGAPPPERIDEMTAASQSLTISAGAVGLATRTGVP